MNLSIIPPWVKPLITLAAGVLLALAAISAIYAYGQQQFDLGKQAERAAWLERENKELLDARAQSKAETARANGLSDKLAKTEAEHKQKTQEVSREVAIFTFGRPCLDGRAVRLLNANQPDSAAVSAGPGASVAADGAVATDTDVAGWDSLARGQYDVCRARLDALIDYEEGKPHD